jgi:hypothetical protein
LRPAASAIAIIPDSREVSGSPSGRTITRGSARQRYFETQDRLRRQSQWSPILRFFLAEPNFLKPTMWQAFSTKATPIEKDKHDNRETVPLAIVA